MSPIRIMDQYMLCIVKVFSRIIPDVIVYRSTLAQTFALLLIDDACFFSTVIHGTIIETDCTLISLRQNMLQFYKHTKNKDLTEMEMRCVPYFPASRVSVSFQYQRISAVLFVSIISRWHCGSLPSLRNLKVLQNKMQCCVNKILSHLLFAHIFILSRISISYWMLWGSGLGFFFFFFYYLCPL